MMITDPPYVDVFVPNADLRTGGYVSVRVVARYYKVVDGRLELYTNDPHSDDPIAVFNLGVWVYFLVTPDPDQPPVVEAPFLPAIKRATQVPLISANLEDTIL